MPPERSVPECQHTGVYEPARCIARRDVSSIGCWRHLIVSEERVAFTFRVTQRVTALRELLTSWFRSVSSLTMFSLLLLVLKVSFCHFLYLSSSSGPFHVFFRCLSCFPCGVGNLCDKGHWRAAVGLWAHYCNALLRRPTMGSGHCCWLVTSDRISGRMA
jgi:hypothetical protein